MGLGLVFKRLDSATRSTFAFAQFEIMGNWIRGTVVLMAISFGPL